MWVPEEILINAMETMALAETTLCSLNERIQTLLKAYETRLRTNEFDFAVPDRHSNFESEYESIIDYFMEQIVSESLNLEEIRKIARSLVMLRRWPSG